jgi:hypothetical protein
MIGKAEPHPDAPIATPRLFNAGSPPEPSPICNSV